MSLLDHRLVEFTWQVRSEYKVRNGQRSWLWRQVFDRYVTRELMDRPKQGVGIPLTHLLRALFASGPRRCLTRIGCRMRDSLIRSLFARCRRSISPAKTPAISPVRRADVPGVVGS